MSLGLAQRLAMWEHARCPNFPFWVNSSHFLLVTGLQEAGGGTPCGPKQACPRHGERGYRGWTRPQDADVQPGDLGT